MTNYDRRLTDRLAAAEKEHRDLDREIKKLSRCPGSNHVQLGEMKRKKLQLKEQIERMKSLLSSEVNNAVRAA